MTLLFCSVASADSVWTYTGNTTSGASNVPTSNPCNCAIDGTVTLDDAGNAIAWNFTDGTHTLTQLNSTGTIDSDLIGTGSTFFTWSVKLQTGDGVSLFSDFIGSTFEATDSVVAGGSLFMFEEGNHGLWTEQTIATPEPGTAVLLAIGLAMFGVTVVAARKSLSF